MNRVTLIGTVTTAPAYHCTERGRDLCRFALRTLSGTRATPTRQSHYCIAWGEPALRLHEHLRAGDRLLVQGELRYLERRGPDGNWHERVTVRVTKFSFLGRAVGSAPRRVRAARVAAVE